MFHPRPGMLITKFVCENPRADNIMMSNVADCADKSLLGHEGLPLWAAINWSHNSLCVPAVHYTVI